MSDAIVSSAKPSSSRREFLKTTSTLVAGGAAFGSLSLARSAHAAENDDTLRIALIGCGGRGTGAAADALSEGGNVKLVAVADAFADQIERSLKSLGPFSDKIDVPADRQFVGFDAYKQAIDAGVDVVILTTSPGFRPMHFEAAVAAGKHVFMEKPVAVDAPGVRKILAAAEEAKKKNLKVGVGLQRHHEKVYLETIQRLQDGAIGDILAARVYWNGAGIWTRPRQPNQTEMEYQMRNWYYFNWLCGDHICEQHIHNLDVINWLKNGYPVEANGMGGREVRKGEDYGQIYDHHFVEFTYADGSKMFSQCRHIPNTWSSVSEHVHGTKGTCHIGGGSIAGENKWRFGEKGPNPYRVEHVDLFAAIRSDKPYNEAEFGALSTMTSILGRMATYSGQVIKWDEALASQIDYSPKEYSFKATPPVIPDASGNYPVPVPGVTKTV